MSKPPEYVPEIPSSPSTEPPSGSTESGSLPSAAAIRAVERTELSVLQELNARIFDGDRIIRSWDHPDLLMLLAYLEDRPVGFKIGYGRAGHGFYSAKGGVLPAYRRRGIGRALLHAMMDRAEEAGYRRFSFHTLPNRHPGMTVLGLKEGFSVRDAGYHPEYEDYILRFERALPEAE